MLQIKWIQQHKLSKRIQMVAMGTLTVHRCAKSETVWHLAPAITISAQMERI